MENIAGIVGTVCIAVMIMGLLYNSAKFPATDKVIKFVVAGYIILSILNIVTKNKIQFTFNIDSTYSAEYTENFMNLLIDKTQSELEKQIEQQLKQKNISYNRVDVHILEQNNSLSIQKITVDCNDKDIGKVKECIKAFIDNETLLYIGETNG